MENNLIPINIRVDFYSTGEIIPIGIIDKCGETIFIDKILKIKSVVIEKNKLMKHFVCRSREKTYNLFYSDNKWFMNDSAC